jgi:hypothetical protein
MCDEQQMCTLDHASVAGTCLHHDGVRRKFPMSLKIRIDPAFWDRKVVFCDKEVSTLKLFRDRQAR